MPLCGVQFGMLLSFSSYFFSSIPKPYNFFFSFTSLQHLHVARLWFGVCHYKSMPTCINYKPNVILWLTHSLIPIPILNLLFFSLLAAARIAMRRNAYVKRGSFESRLISNFIFFDVNNLLDRAKCVRCTLNAIFHATTTFISSTYYIYVNDSMVYFVVHI